MIIPPFILSAERERVITPFQPRRADAGAARTSPQEYTIRENELHVKQVLLVTPRGLQDRKAFRRKLSNLYRVSLPHNLLHSNNDGPK